VGTGPAVFCLLSHVKMGAFWGGMSQVLLIDCLKSGVIKPDLYDPGLNPLYRQMAEHYGCFVDPARPGRPKDKGKVERVVPPVRDLFRRLKAMHPGLRLAEANKKALYWCRYENGMTPHGTTGEKPWECFQATEANKLLALPRGVPAGPVEDRSKYMSINLYNSKKPTTRLAKQYVGRQLWLRATTPRALNSMITILPWSKPLRGPGRRFSDPGDFPENIQAMMNRNYSVRSLLDKAAGLARILPATWRLFCSPMPWQICVKPWE
jgi:hypothetical protein